MDRSALPRDEKWHVCRCLIGLALEYDCNCIQQWDADGATLCYSGMSHEQSVMLLFERCGLMANEGLGVRFRLLHHDFEGAADALSVNVDFEDVLASVVAETCGNHLLSTDTEPFELTFNQREEGGVRTEIVSLLHHLTCLGYVSTFADDDGSTRYQWTEKMTRPMHENYFWGGVPQEE